MRGGDGGATGGLWKTVEGVKMVCVYMSLNINIILLISADMFIYQNKIINEAKRHLNSLYCSWIANSCDGDTALCENM
jgi:hypothetical protein